MLYTSTWTQMLLPSWHLKKLASGTSYNPSCRIVNHRTLIVHNHQFGATSVYLIFYSESAVWKVYLWISCSSSFWTLDCLVRLRFKFVSKFSPTPFIGWHENIDLYYLAFPEDRVHLKCLVYGVYFLEFVQSVLVVDAMFRTFVTMFGDVQALDQIETLWLSIPILTAISEFACIEYGWFEF